MDYFKEALIELSKKHEIIAFQEFANHTNLSILESQKVLVELEKQGKIKVLHWSDGCPIAFEVR